MAATYGVFNGVIQDNSGNALYQASIEVRLESTGAVATIYSGREGAALANPFTSDSDGGVNFYALPGLYKITATKGSTTRTLRYVNVGIAGDYGNGWKGDATALDAYVNETNVARIAEAGNRVAGYMRVGSLTAPTNVTAGDLTVTRLAVNSNTAFATDARAVRVSASLTATSGSEVAALISADVAPTGNSSSNARALTMSLVHGTSFNQTGTEVTSSRFENRIGANSGTITSMSAVYAAGMVAAGAASALGSVGSIYSVFCQPLSSFSNALTTTITGAYGLRVANSTKNTFTLTGQCGLCVSTLAAGNNNVSLLIGTETIPSGNYAVYSTSTNNSYLAGNLGIGNTAPANKLDITGSFGRGAPVTKTADFALAATENWLLNNKSGSTCTVTLPAASSWTGREVMLSSMQAQALVSASSNVVPKGGGAAGTAILPATIGAWAVLVSDGTNWIIMFSGT